VSEVIFQGTDYKVVHYKPDIKTTDSILFTLNPWRKEPGFYNTPFAISVAQERGMEYLGVVPNENCWWQKPEFSLALNAINERLKGRPVIAYGSSMGAYGLINFSNKINMTRGLAFVPQYSIDRVKVPFEKRWKEEAALQTFENDFIAHATLTTPFDCVYDEEHVLDRQHIALLKPRMTSSRFISLPNSGHNPAARLLALGKLKQSVSDWILTGSLEHVC
jgi:hypothetical protein